MPSVLPSLRPLAPDPSHARRAQAAARAFGRRLRDAQRRRAAMKATLGPGPLSAPRDPQALGPHDPR